MKIFVILKNLYPLGKASTARIRCYTKGLTLNNVKCNVIIPISVEKYGKSPINTEKEGFYDGTYYKYIAKSPQRGSNVFIRQYNDFIDYIKTLLYIKKHVHQGDIVIIYEGGVLWHRLCANIVHSVGAKAVMELNELPYGTESETKTNIRKRKEMLNKAFPLYDGFLAISTALEQLALQYNPKAKTLKIPIITEDYPEPPANKEKEIYLFHSGSLSEQKDGILGMIEAFGEATQCISQPIKYYLTGNLKDSPHAKEIKQIIKRYHIEDKIIFLGFLKEDKLREYQRNCYLTIINKYDTQQNKYCFSTKLAEYLAFKRPVIITNIGEASYYLKDNVNAFIVSPHNPHLIAEKIIEAINNPEKAKKIGEEGYKLVTEDFNCEFQAKRMIKFFHDLYTK